MRNRMLLDVVHGVDTRARADGKRHPSPIETAT
jgi:hypothetical protein